MSPKGKSKGPKVTAGSQEARQIASVILEVLAGVTTPADAAVALGMSMPKYYTLEVRSLNAMIESCEPKPKGRVQTPASKMEAMEKEMKGLKQSQARQQALLRAARRAMGLTPKVEKKPAPANGKRRRASKPSPRALKVVQLLKKPVESAAIDAPPAVLAGA